jgi:hypothetical protein
MNNVQNCDSYNNETMIISNVWFDFMKKKKKKEILLKTGVSWMMLW